MREKALQLLGLMRRASAIAAGETGTGAAVRGGKAKLLLIAEDASENARSRAEGFAAGRRVIVVPLPFTRAELAGSLGLSGCSMAAVTDLGFAQALMKLLASEFPERYEDSFQEIQRRFSKAQRRKAETEQARNKRNGKRRTSV